MTASVVQTKTLNVTSAAAQTVTFNTAPTVDNLIVAVMNFADSNVTATPTMPTGWVQRYSPGRQNGNWSPFIYDHVVASGDTGLTFTPAHSDFITVILVELSGVSGFGSLGTPSSLNVATVFTTLCPSMSTGSSGDLVLAVSFNGSGVSISTETWTTGWTGQATVADGSGTSGVRAGVASQVFGASATTGDATCTDSTTSRAQVGLQIAYTIAAASVTGSGAVTAPHATGAGAGTVSLTGSATVTTGHASASAAASLSLTGSGTASAPAATASGAADVIGEHVTGQGATTAPAATGQATGTLAISGSGTATAPAVTGTGTATLLVQADAAVLAAAAQAQALATLTVTGSAAITAPPAHAHGTNRPPLPTPPSRTYRVPARNRTIRVAARNRTVRVATRNRSTP